MNALAEDICGNFFDNPDFVKVKFSLFLTYNDTISSPHFYKSYKKRKYTLRNLKCIAQDRKQYCEDLLTISNLYCVVSSMLSLTCECCMGKLSKEIVVQLKQIGKDLKHEETVKQRTDTHASYFLAFLKLVNVDQSVNFQHSFSPYARKMSDQIAVQYNSKYLPSEEVKQNAGKEASTK